MCVHRAGWFTFRYWPSSFTARPSVLRQRNCALPVYTSRPLRCGEAILTSLTTRFTATTCPYKQFCATSVRELWVGSFIFKGKVLHYRRYSRQIKMNVMFYVKCNVFLSAAPSPKRWWNIICEVLKIEAFFTLFCALELQLNLKFKFSYLSTLSRQVIGINSRGV
jgi:hypothetical protein